MQTQAFESSWGPRGRCACALCAYEGDGENGDFGLEKEIKLSIIPALGHSEIRGKETSLSYWKETSRVYLHVPMQMRSAHSGPIRMFSP